MGRLACGVVGDWALTRHHIPRPAVFGWFIWMMAAAMLLLAIGNVPALYAATIVGGISYGALNGERPGLLACSCRLLRHDVRGCAGITPPILSEMYGNKHFGAIYTANALAEGAGSYAMATWLFSAEYEREIDQGSGGSASGSDGADGKDCYGRQCFLWTAWISAVLCAFSALLCVWLGAPQSLRARWLLLRARAGQVGGRSHATTRCKARPIEPFEMAKKEPQLPVHQ